MPREPLPMRKIQSVLDLSRVQGLSVRKVTTRLGLKRSTVSDCRMESMIAALLIQRNHPQSRGCPSRPHRCGPDDCRWLLRAQRHRYLGAEIETTK